LFVFWISIFFLINILDLYLDLLILYHKAKDPKIISRATTLADTPNY